MEPESKDLRNKVLEYFKTSEGRKFTIDELQCELTVPKKELRKEVKNLIAENVLKAVPVKRTGRWHWFYYFTPGNQMTVNQRLEEIFEELAIPPYIDIMLNRRFQVIFIGKYGSRPGFSIIDFSFDLPLVFRDKMYGGENDEITFFKQRSRYVCKKGDIEIWYNLHGQKM